MQFIKMAWLDFKGHRSAFNFEEFITLETLYPLMTLIFYCVTAGYAHQSADVSTWVVGNAFLLCTNMCVFSLGNGFTGERYFGRIRSIIVGDLSKLTIVMQKGFFSIFFSMLTTLVGFAIGCMVFHVPVLELPWGDLFVIFAVGMFAAVGFGMFLSVIGLVSDQMHLILNLVQYILLIFTGANFPVSQLPGICQLLSNLLPLTRSIAAAREVIANPQNGLPIGLLAGEIIVGVAFLIIAALIVEAAERAAIKKGTLELF